MVWVRVPYVCMNCKVKDDHYSQHCPKVVCFKCMESGHTANLCGKTIVKEKPESRWVQKIECKFGKECCFQDQCRFYHDLHDFDLRKRITASQAIKKQRRIKFSSHLNKVALRLMESHAASIKRS